MLPTVMTTTTSTPTTSRPMTSAATTAAAAPDELYDWSDETLTIVPARSRVLMAWLLLVATGLLVTVGGFAATRGFVKRWPQPASRRRHHAARRADPRDTRRAPPRVHVLLQADLVSAEVRGAGLHDAFARRPGRSRDRRAEDAVHGARLGRIGRRGRQRRAGVQDALPVDGALVI